MDGEVAIVGAGIGGLALARALELAGIGAQVFEQAAQFGEVGAGLVVQPGAMLALRRLGLEEAVRLGGREIGRLGTFTQSGAVLQDVDLLPLQAELGAAVLVLHRARLHEILRGSLARTPLRAGVRLVHLEQDESGVCAQFADGSRVRSALLIGADGLHSAVRRALRGEEPLRYAGYTSWRGIARRSGTRAAGAEYWGRGERFGMAPLSADEVYWFAVANAAAGGRDEDPRSELLRRYASWASPIPQLIEATPAARILRTDIHDREPIASWSRGRVALLGDAAHPTTPNLGLGACLAIEDAVALASALVEHGAAQDALRAYERQRVGRARRIVLASRRLGRLAQLEGRLVTRLRDRVLRALPERAVRRQLLRNARG